jgi:S-adenosylmethionine decarboxylase proenzyme
MDLCPSNELKNTVGTAGVHLIGDLYQCKTGHDLMTDAELLKPACLELCRDAGLQVVGNTFYQFESAGVTGCILLAESHVAIHTWPELSSVTVDVYVCNFNMDNSEKAHRVFDGIVKLFAPADARTRNVQRGEL